MYVYSSAGEANSRSGGERVRTDVYIRTDGQTDEAVMECPRGGIKGIVYTGFTESGDEI
jgi:hypothetical protein